jgi:energy-coupling factor transport system substrate-specific component
MEYYCTGGVSLNRNTVKIVLCGLAIAINVIAGSIVGNLKLPLLFLDTVGTIFIAVMYGPYWAFSVGILTNLVLGVTAEYTNIPFGLVNGAVGLITGFVARKFGFTFWSALITGIVLSIICPIIGTPIAVALFGGLTGGGSDIFVLWLKNTGTTMFAAVFIPRLADNLVDKILSCLLVLAIVRNLPVSMLRRIGAKVKGPSSYEA